MRISLTILGREIAAVTIDPEEFVLIDEHDHLGAEIERSEPAPLGFHIDRNPSLEDDEEDDDV